MDNRTTKLSRERGQYLLNNAIVFAAEVLASLICEKCGAALGEPSGPDDCVKCKPIRDFMGFERASHIVRQPEVV